MGLLLIASCQKIGTCYSLRRRLFALLSKYDGLLVLFIWCPRMKIYVMDPLVRNVKLVLSFNYQVLIVNNTVAVQNESSRKYQQILGIFRLQYTATIFPEVHDFIFIVCCQNWILRFATINCTFYAPLVFFSFLIVETIFKRLKKNLLDDFENSLKKLGLKIKEFVIVLGGMLEQHIKIC